MRKISILCLAVLLVLALAGCSGLINGISSNVGQGSSLPEEIWEIEDEFEFVYEMYMYIAEKCDYGSNLDALSKPERVFFITQTLEMEVNNGGFWQFFFNADEDVFLETAAAFDEIGAKKTAELYRNAVDAFDEEMPSSRGARIKMLSKIGIEKCYDILTPYDEQFYEYEEDLDALNYAYIHSNRNAFS